MNWRAFVAILLCLIGGCDKKPPHAKPPPPSLHQLPTHAQPRLPTLKLWIGEKEMIAELALTPQQQEIGMMFRTAIDEDTGMLFVFSQPIWLSLWMKNCPLPLSAAYIDADGKIIELHDLEPNSEKEVSAASNNVQYVLETSRGWFEENHVAVGTIVKTERGSLKQAFFSKH